MSIAVVIPARLSSERLPRKVLLKETGKFLIQHVWEQVLRAKNVDQIIIATDSTEVAEAVRAFGASAVMTSTSHVSGTDRVAEVARGLRVDSVVNVQGDEPEIDPRHIEKTAQLLVEFPEASMSTLGAPFDSIDEVNDPNKVKVVCDRRGFALYFSRSRIPYVRDVSPDSQLSTPSTVLRTGLDPRLYLRHLGIYGYRRDFLLSFTSLPQGNLERVEKLEQLRALENGYRIVVGEVARGSSGVDTMEDYRAFIERYKKSVESRAS